MASIILRSHASKFTESLRILKPLFRMFRSVSVVQATLKYVQLTLLNVRVAAESWGHAAQH